MLVVVFKLFPVVFRVSLNTSVDLFALEKPNNTKTCFYLQYGIFLEAVGAKQLIMMMIMVRMMMMMMVMMMLMVIFN